jgi:hypothetical protein
MNLGRCSCEFAFFCAVDPRNVRASLADSSRLADSPLGIADHSVDRLDRTGVFRLEAFSVQRTVHACLPDSPPLPWRTVRGSQADSLIYTQNLAKFDRFLCFFSSASACASRNRSQDL